MPNSFPNSASQLESKTEISTSNDVISFSDSTNYALTINVSGSNLTITNGTKYLSYGSSTNFAFNTTCIGNADKWTAAYNDLFTITNVGTTTRAILYRTSTQKFGAFATSNIGNSDYNQLYLFREYNPTDYAEDFLSTVTCNGGTTPPSTTNWSTMNTKYGYLSTSDKNILKTSSASKTGTTVEQAMARYDYIVGKYGSSTYSDFILRNPAPISGQTSVPANNSNTYLIVLIASLSSVISVSILLLTKKKKRTK